MYYHAVSLFDLCTIVVKQTNVHNYESFLPEMIVQKMHNEEILPKGWYYVHDKCRFEVEYAAVDSDEMDRLQEEVFYSNDELQLFTDINGEVYVPEFMEYLLMCKYNLHGDSFKAPWKRGVQQVLDVHKTYKNKFVKKHFKRSIKTHYRI
ncbi:Hypothetical protein Trvi_ORF134 [Trabala vishnou gigantina nucleopolyhedrovirus]|uniref:Hypothetical protein n=1 Tax=Trabala vishnou gigantina nucleopolyhedrovirus TaxID=2863583 RepID=UPI002481D64D|nr:Hypothetical protein QKU87_gp134 [Trabala vishnou gigantina nucleopolyhedrovirus]QYC92751.1 Hypothetical protein Trvi_ORF134 [Trabala vishnou gigantina nucleopolyhedrovirus]